MGISLSVWVVAGLMVLCIFLIMGVLTRLYQKAGPHEALIVYGFRGTRVVKGGGTVLFPLIEECRMLSLELMSFDVAPQQDMYTRQGVAVTVEAVAQIKVKSDPESIRTASEQFLTKLAQEREGLIRLVMEGHLRGIIGQLTVEQIVKEPEMVAERMRGTCADDMNKMGLEVISFTIKEVRDKNDYISNMGRPDVARIKRDADVAAAEAERDTAINAALAQREAAVARAQADQERVLAETLSLTRQAEAQRDAEAQAMNVKAEAFQEYNQAAVIDKLLTSLPEIVRALATPLANVDKITIVSTGNGDSAGVNKLTGDITKMAAQAPALFEALSGMTIPDLLSKVRRIGDRAEEPQKRAQGVAATEEEKI